MDEQVIFVPFAYGSQIRGIYSRGSLAIEKRY